MNRRIIYIILGSLLLLALILGLWFWFFGGSGNKTPTPNLFGTGGDKTGTGTNGTGTGGNDQGTIGSNTGTGTTTQGTGNGTGSGVGTSTGSQGTAGGGVGGTGSGANGTGGPGGTTPGGDTNPDGSPVGPGDQTPDATPPPDISFNDNIDTGYVFSTSTDIIWNDGSFFDPSTFNLPGTTVFFNPTPITQIDTSTVTGTPHITKVIGPDGTEISLTTSLAVLLGGCLLSYAANYVYTYPPSLLRNLADGGILKVQTSDTTNNASTESETIIQCLTRTLGKMAVQAITDSIVNWINAGFQGKPSFVQDFQKFFADVADQAAGEFLQSSNFAFLCSPFQAQVRIAVAQSYARRNNAPSCTLSDATGGFTSGNFGRGGWGNLISFTTEPSNHPFGAFQILQNGLSNAVQTDVRNKTLEVNLGSGFLSYQQCDPGTGGTGSPINAGGKNCKIVTPGSAIESSLQTAFGQSVASLQIGDSITQILGALQNALVTKALYGGLTNVGQNTSADNVDSAAQAAATTLMTEMRGSAATTQSYATVEQRIITDVQTVQSKVVDLQNCWLMASSSPTLTAAGRSSVNVGVSAATSRLTLLQQMVVNYNQNIDRANQSTLAIQQLQTNLLLSSIATDVAAVRTQWNTLRTGSSPHIYTATDVTTAQQDRTSTQNTLAGITTEVNAGLQQCNALL